MVMEIIDKKYHIPIINLWNIIEKDSHLVGGFHYREVMQKVYHRILKIIICDDVDSSNTDSAYIDSSHKNKKYSKHTNSAYIDSSHKNKKYSKHTNLTLVSSFVIMFMMMIICIACLICIKKKNTK